ncbi:hypothetical protein LQ938_02370 [Microbacterium sp. cx-55]|uniref:hypothetical protein n=1 Tax=Microbacterium sp. cx-55 TaxID=2875948 RepID=UPI001CBDED54|nr:hypothetical protein [Microbacterium sp. cx-55]MBZ4487652.1 hypothetical protein [Microbacterium sp. cx-55]UGB35664.1 hypothetical protein LQ938_02370 [Microbacterium sp. cx-55]
MPRRLSRFAAASALAAILTLVPVAAFAYPPNDAARVTQTSVDPGGSVQLSVAADVFTPGEQVTITVRGENASGVTFAMVRTALETRIYTDARANSDGGLDPLTVTFPADAAGAYTIAVFSPSTPGDTVTVTVGSLSVTGIDSQSVLGIWVGGAALIVAGALIAVTATVARHRRRHAD